MCAPLRISNLLPEAIGESIAKVEFYNGAALLGTATTAPYSHTWTNVPVGSYDLTAKAIDALGIATTSATITVTAIANVPPAVSLTSPANGTTMKVPGNFTLTADAASTTSTIAKVDFYAIDNATNASTLIGTATQVPYTANWSNVPLGSYTLSAVATDTLGAVTTSSSVTVTVNTGIAQAYYIHTDHLDTPRTITDTAGNIVWQWDNTDPFGANMANENPNGAGQFSFNLRFPGQYYDRETNTHYNFHRDYDPATGRYIESDPIGLAGGINTYAYVDGNPISLTDPSGNCPFCVVAAIGLLELLNAIDTANDVVDTANTLSDNCASAGEKWGAVGMLALGIIDPTPGNLSKKVHWSKQQQHLPGHPDFIPGKSEVTANPEKLLEKAGTGTPLGPNKERVDFGEIIGKYVDPVTGTGVPTTKGIIHTGKNGSHVVPSRP